MVLLTACRGHGGDGGTGGVPGANPCQGVDCSDRNDCTVDVCDPADGSCSNTVQADDSFCDLGYCQAGECEPIASVFPCTEQGVRAAIAEGGGPHGFDCTGPRVIATEAEIVIDNDVILDGRKMTVNANLTHRVFSVTEGTMAELWRVTVTRGHWQEFTLGGGGIYNEGTLGLRNCTVSESEALQECGAGTCFDGAGGGILNAGTMTVVNTTVRNNRATGGGVGARGGGVGGGISNEGTLTLEQSTISGNSGALWGGGLHNGRGPTLLGATLRVINSTISNNVATNAGATPGRGGGIANEGTLTVLSTTFSVNNAARGDGIATSMGTVTLANTLIDDRCEGNITSNGYNLESTGDTCGLNQSTDLVDVTAADLDIEPLFDRGGPTYTHALSSNSVAIDAIPVEDCLDLQGEPLAADQRGIERPQGTACDIGSFEREER
jgi:hypothetical protein